MSEVVNPQVENEEVVAEANVQEEKVTKEVPSVVDCVLFNKASIDAAIEILDNISIKGTDNIMAIANLSNILKTQGTPVPVTVQN